MLLVSSPLAAVEVRYNSGFDSSMLEVLEREPAITELQSSSGESTDREYAQKLENAREAVEKVLKYLGYYNARLRFTSEVGSVVFDLQPGPATRIGQVRLNADTADGRRRLQEYFTLRSGERFTHPGYEAARKHVLQSFEAQGFLKAAYLESRVVVNPAAHTADIHFRIREGPRYRFGPVQVSGLSDYPQGYYHQWLKFSRGEVFSQQKLLGFYRAVQDSGLFESVSIRADPDEAVADEVPVIFSVKSYPPYSVKAAVGYATDFGPRLRLNLKRYNVFNTGHSLQTDLVIDTRQQFLRANYLIPVTDRPDRAWSVFATVQNRDLPDDRQRRVNAGFGYSAMFDNRGEYHSGVAYNFESFTDNAQQETLSGYLDASLRRIWLSLDDNIDPSSGTRFQISGRAVAQPLLSDFSALRIDTHGTAYYAILQKWIRIKARLQLGYLLASRAPGDMPNSFRFFSGGDRSVRGYGYQTLAPRDPLTGDVVGGKAVFTTSFETEFRVYGNFGWVFYTDYGGATDTFSDQDFGFSVGSGLRWHSPVGPMGVSVAFPLKNRAEDFRIVVTVGSL